MVEILRFEIGIRTFEPPYNIFKACFGVRGRHRGPLFVIGNQAMNVGGKRVSVHRAY